MFKFFVQFFLTAVLLEHAVITSCFLSEFALVHFLIINCFRSFRVSDG